MTLWNKIKRLVSSKTLGPYTIKDEVMTVVVPCNADTDDEKADYILRVVDILEKNIQIINKKTKENERRESFR